MSTSNALLPFIMLLALTPANMAGATDVAAASCSYADVSVAVANADGSGGGTVTIPPCPLTDWGSNGITLNTTNEIRIEGAGVDLTTIRSSAGTVFRLGTDDNSGGVRELCCMTIDHNNGAGSTLRYDGMQEAPEFRMHHMKMENFSGGNRINVCQNESGVALFDHLTIDAGAGNNAGYGFFVYGPGPNRTYTMPSTTWGANNTNAVFIEDSTVIETGGHVIAGFTGANIVIRHNTFDGPFDTALDAHNFGWGQGCGQASTDPSQHANNFGSYQLEIHDNTWSNSGYGACIRPRSGTAMVTDNTCGEPDMIVFATERGKWDHVPDEVTGTDGNIYSSIRPHISTNDSRPTTGASWDTHWTRAGVAGGPWAPGKTFYPGCRPQSGCVHSFDINDWAAAVSGDPEIYNLANGKLIRAPDCYFIPHQWWIWNNDVNTAARQEDSSNTGCMRENQEYYLRAPQTGDPVESYTKHPYPHPLQSMGMAPADGRPDGRVDSSAGAFDGGPAGSMDGGPGASDGDPNGPASPGGCGCRVDNHEAPLGLGALVLGVLLALRRRRSRGHPCEG